MKGPFAIAVIAVMVLLMALPLPLLSTCNGGNGTKKPTSPTAPPPGGARISYEPASPISVLQMPWEYWESLDAVCPENQDSQAIYEASLSLTQHSMACSAADLPRHNGHLSTVWRCIWRMQLRRT